LYKYNILSIDELLYVITQLRAKLCKDGQSSTIPATSQHPSPFIK